MKYTPTQAKVIAAYNIAKMETGKEPELKHVAEILWLSDKTVYYHKKNIGKVPYIKTLKQRVRKIQIEQEELEHAQNVRWKFWS